MRSSNTLEIQNKYIRNTEIIHLAAQHEMNPMVPIAMHWFSSIHLLRFNNTRLCLCTMCATVQCVWCATCLCADQWDTISICSVFLTYLFPIFNVFVQCAVPAGAVLFQINGIQSGWSGWEVVSCWHYENISDKYRTNIIRKCTQIQPSLQKIQYRYSTMQEIQGSWCEKWYYSMAA